MVLMFLPLHRVFLQKTREQRTSLRAEGPREADVLHEDELKQLLVVLVVEGQPAAHHLVHHHPETPPVHSTAVVVVFQDLEDVEGQEDALKCSCIFLLDLYLLS